MNPSKTENSKSIPETSTRPSGSGPNRELVLPEDPVGASLEGPSPPSLGSAELYLNRELTWLAFCWRVLAEAEDARNPLLERVKFLAIVSGNLDEFFMKRIGGLKQQLAAGVREPTVDGRTPGQQIEEAYAFIEKLDERRVALFEQLRRLLKQADVQLLRIRDLKEEQRLKMRDEYLRNVFPLVTPQAMDPAHPFPFVSNLSLNLLVTVRYPGDPATMMSRVKVPIGSGIPRWMRVDDQQTFVALEEVMAENLDILFPGMEVVACELFRVTRNANTELDEEEADDLLAMIETELRDRRFAPIVRLEVGSEMSLARRSMLAAELGLDADAEVRAVHRRFALVDLLEIAAIDRPDLRDPSHRPIDNVSLTPERNIFHVLRDAGGILLHHPYESFSTSVERFLLEAARDSKVRAIKMTLYRTSAETKVIDHLLEAVRNGKQVAVVVELKARFDEDANILWASRLEEMGIHVTYGVVGLKTHCKTILVVRQDHDGLRRYAHIGTGNYHSGTARVYSDLGLMTSDEEIGADLTELFNYLTTGYKPRRKYKHLLVAPVSLKSALIEKIEREVDHLEQHRFAHIQMKMNALEDADITRALYRAARAGVRIDLLIRDTCRLRPKISGLTENVRVVSIVGQFLEHARLYYFANGNQPEYWIGSADCMKRNLESRVEVLVPVLEESLQLELRSYLDLQLEDREDAWEMMADGRYERLSALKGSGRKSSSQARLIELADKRRKAAGRLKKRKTRGIARRTLS
ncbi:polyphosphate kinase 1 [bacterium]|nr:polyphosphate kinase 1 [bacterium]